MTREQAIGEIASHLTAAMAIGAGTQRSAGKGYYAVDLPLIQALITRAEYGKGNRPALVYFKRWQVLYVFVAFGKGNYRTFTRLREQIIRQNQSLTQYDIPDERHAFKLDAGLVLSLRQVTQNYNSVMEVM